MTVSMKQMYYIVALIKKKQLVCKIHFILVSQFLNIVNDCLIPKKKKKKLWVMNVPKIVIMSLSDKPPVFNLSLGKA